MQTCCRVDATAHAKWSIASKMLVLQQHWSVRWMRRLWAVAQCTHPAYVHPVALAGLTLQSLIERTMVPLRFSSMARRWFSESAIGNWFPQGCPECADVKPSGTFWQCHLQRGSLGLTAAHSGHLIAFRRRKQPPGGSRNSRKWEFCRGNNYNYGRSTSVQLYIYSCSTHTWVPIPVRLYSSTMVI